MSDLSGKSSRSVINVTRPFICFKFSRMFSSSLFTSLLRTRWSLNPRIDNNFSQWLVSAAAHFALSHASLSPAVAFSKILTGTGAATQSDGCLEAGSMNRVLGEDAASLFVALGVCSFAPSLESHRDKSSSIRDILKRSTLSLSARQNTSLEPREV